MLCVIVLLISGTDTFAQRRSKTQKTIAQKVQNVRISLTERGYQPESFTLRKGIPARVTFIRKTEDDCGKEVVFPAYNIKRTLPLNTPVTIRFTPQRSGSFSFVCGMDMLSGKFIVQ